ncbi:hypothetical protein [Streptomyces sp. NPDC000410]|uniref:hypothetical protein n=1 Tax=Streptomyces sp. NPDC000410 TaxID=3154254 RepID=UPI00332CC913
MFGKLLIPRGIGALGAAFALLLAGPWASQRAEAASVCSGRPVKSVSFATGELRVYKSRQYVCALTATKQPGTTRYMSVSLQPRGGRAAVDKGRFTQQAGPVTVHALNRCVRVTGSVGGRSVSTGWILC